MINNMNELPTLYHRGKTGAMIEWKVWVEGDTYIVEWGQIGGAKQIAKVVCEAKNVGRANSTTPQEQAIFEAKAKWQYQRDRKYRESIEEAKEVVFLPSPARQKVFQWGGKEKLLRFPVDVQRKFDGVRCLAYREGNEVLLISRNGLQWTAPHIAKALADILPEDCVLDGEMYVHGVGFQTITSWVKRLQPETEQVEFHIYDCPEYNGITEESWSVRKQHLAEVMRNAKKPLILTDTYSASSEKEIKTLQKQFVSEGFEGAIVRILTGIYKYGERSNYVLKVKDFIDAEYEVVGAETGKKGSKEENAVIWICKNKNGDTFSVRPKGSIKDREKAYKTARSRFGQLYKVKFFEYTDDGLPRFPVGLGFRDKADMS